MEIALSKLAEPFPADDIEWRVSRAGSNSRGVYCRVVAYITARAIQRRLDEVVGPENWRNECPQFRELPAPAKSDAKSIGPAVIAGLSIRIDGEWVTKWNVAEPTNFEAVKGGFSQAIKRAGAEWGIGRYLYRLDETFAEVSETSVPGYKFEKLPGGGGTYYWKPPRLPDWALPDESGQAGHGVTKKALNELKRKWCEKFAPDVKSRNEKRDGFERFVHRVAGEFPCHDYECWTPEVYDKVGAEIAATPVDVNGDASVVPFGDE